MFPVPGKEVGKKPAKSAPPPPLSPDEAEAIKNLGRQAAEIADTAALVPELTRLPTAADMPFGKKPRSMVLGGAGQGTFASDLYPEARQTAELIGGFTPDEQARIQEWMAVASQENPFLYDLGTPEGSYRARAAAALIVSFARDYPEIAELADTAFGQAVNATALDRVFGQPGSEMARLTGTDLTRNFLHAVMSVADQATDPFKPAETIMRDSQAEAEWQLNFSRRALIEGTGADAEVTGEIPLVIGALGDQPVYANLYEGGRLIITAPRDDGAVQNIIDIQLAPGTKLERPADVVHALNAVIAGGEHDLLRMDDLRGDRTMLGSAAFAVGRVVDFGGNIVDVPYEFLVSNARDVLDGGEFEFHAPQSPTTTQQQRNEARARELLAEARRNISPEAVFAAAAQVFREQDPTLSPYGAAQAATDFMATPEGRAYFAQVTDPSTVDSEELVREVRDSMEEESGLKNLLDTGLDKATTVLAAYGQLVDYLGVHAVDIIGDVAQGTVEAFDGAKGLAAFRSTWDWTEANRLSEYWGLDDDVGLLVDLTANIVLDPLAGPFGMLSGGARRAARWEELISDPARVGEVLRDPSMRRVARQFFDAQASGNALAMEALMADMPSFMRGRMLAQPFQSADEVLRYMGSQLPGSGGSWVPNWSGRQATRNNWTQVARMLDKTGGDRGLLDRVRVFLTEASRGTEMSVSPLSMGDDAMDWILAAEAAVPGSANDLLKMLHDFEARAWALERNGKPLVDAALRDIAFVGRELSPITEATRRAMAPLVERFGPMLEGVDGATFMERLEKALDMSDEYLASAPQRTALAEEIARLSASGEDATRLALARDELAAAELSPDVADINRRINNLRSLIKRDTKFGIPVDDYQAQLDDLNRQLAEVESGVPGIARELAAAADTRAALRAQFSEYMNRTGTLRKQLADAQATYAQARQGYKAFDWAKETRKFLERLENEIGRRIGLKPLGKKGRVDWSEIQGTRRGARNLEASTPRRAPLAPDQAGADALGEAGIMTQPMTYSWQVSPEEIIAFVRGRDGGWWEKWLAGSVIAPEGTTTGRRFLRWWGRQYSSAMRGYFAAILSTPRGMVRGFLDEMPFRSSETGVGLRRTFKTGFREPRLPGRPDRSMLAANQIDQGEGINRARGAWRTVSRKKLGGGELVSEKVHRNAAREWLNGAAMRDEGMVAVARAARETAEALGVTVEEVLANVPVSQWVKTAYEDWWIRSGRKLVSGSLKPTKGMILDKADDALERARNGLAFMVKSSDAPTQVADILTRRMAERVFFQGGDAETGWLIRHLGPVPTRHAISDPVGYLPELFYGKPGQYRFGLLHADLYDRALSMWERVPEGRILTPQKLVDIGAAPDLRAAERLMDLYPDEVERIALANGFKTKRMIEYLADRFARKQALNMIYTPGASSILGKKLQKTLFPTGPAQYDFVDYWGDAARRSTRLRYGSQRELALPFSGGNAPLPLNLRLMARASQYANMFQQVKEMGDDNAWWSPPEILDELTFFPRLDSWEHFSTDMGASFGPIPTWVLRMASEWVADKDDEYLDQDPWWLRFLGGVDELVNQVAPTLDWERSGGFSFGAVVRSFLPETPAFQALEGFTDFIRTNPFGDGGVGSAVWSLLPHESGLLDDSPFLRDTMDALVMEELASQAGSINLRVDPEDIRRRAEQIVAGPQLLDSLLAVLPFGRPFHGMGDMTTEQWSGFMAEIPSLVAGGYLEDAIGDDLLAAWNNRANLGGRELADLHSQARTVLFSLQGIPADERSGRPAGALAEARLLVAHPELAYFMGSRYEYKRDPVTGIPLDPLADPSRIGPRMVTEEERERFRENAERYYVERSISTRVAEANWRVAAAKRAVLRDDYLTIFGNRETSFNPRSDSREVQYRNKSITLTDEDVRFYESLNVTGLKAGRMPLREFSAAIADANKALAQFSYPSVMKPLVEDTTLGGLQAELWADPESRVLMEGIAEWVGYAQEQGYDDFATWPQEWKDELQWHFNALVVRGKDGGVTLAEYNALFAGDFGPFQWKADLPGPLDSLDDKDVRFVFNAGPEDVRVVDGDTLDLRTADGWVRFRLIGINAPGDPMPGWEDAYDDLYRLINTDGYVDIKLVVWKPEFFGSTAGINYDTGQDRLKAWLFVNGQPVYHEEAFSWRNPTGRGSGSVYLPLPRPEVAMSEAGV